MVSKPVEFPEGSQPILHDDIGSTWTPLYQNECSFSTAHFNQVMNNLIRNPNIDSNHLFRADILLEAPFITGDDYKPIPKLVQVKDFNLDTVMIRKFIPRNVQLDQPMDQTCLLYSQAHETETKSLVIYLPHISSPPEAPHYHPAVHGIAFLHVFDTASQKGHLSIHFSFFESAPRSAGLQRTAFHLITTVQKHGNGLHNGYVKKVHHDVILPQVKTQNTYARLKTKYAKSLITEWNEVTDPTKHVFEDLGIAAFLIELWADLYPEGNVFPGFVDIGCGNGLLTYILLKEGYTGWGFDARKRRSWDTYAAKAPNSLQELVLVPGIIQSTDEKAELKGGEDDAVVGVHDGNFPKGTFIISNHADELTPWTPILATLSQSPWIAIPCCSHNLTGSRFRAKPPKETGSSSSAYASLVSWVSQLAEDCGWKVEKEMLRIPSTRKACLLGRERTKSYGDVDVAELIAEYGGATGWVDNAMKLVKGGPRGH